MIGNAATRPMEILLVEDGWIDARVTIYAVRRTQVHHRITLVRCVAEAKLFLQQQGIFALAPRPDLVLLDMMLPDGDGFDVIDTISKLETSPESPQPTAVVLTASSDESIREKCDSLQVADFINKPVREEEFMRVIREHKKLMVHSTLVLAAV